jgi:hypothetical protein
MPPSFLFISQAIANVFLNRMPSKDSYCKYTCDKKTHIIQIP